MRRRLSSLRDEILAASITPHHWPEALEALKQALGGVACGLRVETTDGGFGQRWVGLDPAFEHKYVSHYHRHDPWMPAARKLAVGHCVPGHRLACPEEIARSEFYHELMLPFGMGDIFGCVVERSNDALTTFAVLRGRESPTLTAGDLRAVSTLVPLLRHAVVANRLLSQGVDADVSGGLVRQRVAMFVVTRSGAVTYTNEAARALLETGTGVRLRGARLYVVDASSRARLERALASHVPELVGVRAPDGASLLARTQPLPRATSESNLPWLASCVAVLLFDPRTPVDTASLEHAVQRGFGLTPAEARVAVFVGSGNSPKEAAVALGLTEGTVRFQLKQAYAKLNVDGQRGLVKLVVSIT